MAFLSSQYESAFSNFTTRSSSRSRRMRLFASYAPDWAITIILAAIFLSLDKVDGYRREFSVEDTSLRHPFAVHERVPNLALYLICVGAPIVLMPIANLFSVRSLWDLHNSILGLIQGLSLTGAITQIVKITVGRPRPDVISRCRPLPGTVDPLFGLTNSTVCTQTDVVMLRDGFRSFPSGHSSLSFAGLGFLSFYLAGKMHLFDERGHAGKAWLSLAPLAGAALIAVSRTMDYRHHWQDVLVGSLLGLVMAFFAYRQYFPSLTSEFSHRPFAPRISESPILPTVVHQPIASSDSVLGQGLGSSAGIGGGVPHHPPNQRRSSAGNRYRDRDEFTGSPDGETIHEDVELEGTVSRGGVNLKDLYDREEREGLSVNVSPANDHDRGQS